MTADPLRFLLLYSNTGGGHRGAAQAVQEALEDRYGAQAAVEQIDALSEYAPWPFSGAPDAYGKTLLAGGYPYGLGFLLLDGRRRAQALSRFFWPYARQAALRLLAEHPADVVAAFHPIPVWSMCAALKESRSTTPLVAVGTDLAVMHAFYVAPDVRRYLVATEIARAELLRHGVDPAMIEVTGLPIRRSFSQIAHQDPYALREQLGLDPARPLVVVMGGGVGFGPLEQVARAVARARLPAQVVVLTGNNERLRARLERWPLPAPARVQGFTPDVHLWMRAADVLLTKAGPNSIAEALAVGVPMVLWGAIPVQETPNVRWVVDAGAALWAPGPRQATAATARLLEDAAERERMRQQARRLARPEAAMRVAEALWEMAGAGSSPRPRLPSAGCPAKPPGAG